jgi:hypothetical protein
MNVYCLMNHQLTSAQERELINRYGSDGIILPSAEISSAWMNSPVDAAFKRSSLSPFLSWIEGIPPSSAIVLQGEAGAAFALIDYALRRNLIVLHSVTERKVSEVRRGEIVTRRCEFEHICFREYQRIEEMCI